MGAVVSRRRWLGAEPRPTGLGTRRRNDYSSGPAAEGTPPTPGPQRRGMDVLTPLNKKKLSKRVIRKLANFCEGNYGSHVAPYFLILIFVCCHRELHRNILKLHQPGFFCHPVLLRINTGAMG